MVVMIAQTLTAQVIIVMTVLNMIVRVAACVLKWAAPEIAETTVLIGAVLIKKTIVQR